MCRGLNASCTFVCLSSPRPWVLEQSEIVRPPDANAGVVHHPALRRIGPWLGSDNPHGRRTKPSKLWRARDSKDLDAITAQDNFFALTARDDQNGSSGRGPCRCVESAPGNAHKYSLISRNRACRYIIQNMRAAWNEAMPLFRRLRRLFEADKVGSDVRWMPLAVNVHADRLSRTWDPGDAQLIRAALRYLKGWF